MGWSLLVAADQEVPVAEESTIRGHHSHLPTSITVLADSKDSTTAKPTAHSRDLILQLFDEKLVSFASLEKRFDTVMSVVPVELEVTP